MGNSNSNNGDLIPIQPLEPLRSVQRKRIRRIGFFLFILRSLGLF